MWVGARLMGFGGWFSRLFARAPGEISPEAAKPLEIPVLLAGENSPDAPDWPAILRAVGFLAPDAWAAHLAGPAARRGIHRGRRAAAFAATIAHESEGGRKLIESLNYSIDALATGNWRHRFPRADA